MSPTRDLLIQDSDAPRESNRGQRHRFPPENRFQTPEHRLAVAVNPADRIRRDVRACVAAIKAGRLAPAAGTAIATLLRVEIEAIDRFEIGERIAEYERSIASLTERVRGLIER